MTREHFQELLARYRRGECTDSERKVIDDWFSAISTSRRPFFNEADARKLKDRAWSRAARRMRKTGSETPGTMASSIDLRVLSIAASVILMLVTGVYYNSNTNRTSASGLSIRPAEANEKVVENRSETNTEFYLPEGSKIMLARASAIRYAEDFAGRRREVFLEGEAFFDVAPDACRPFFVYTNDVTTKVLGTSFHIKAHHQGAETVVAVKTGQVSVYGSKDLNRHLQEVILLPNEQAVFNTGRRTLKKLVDEPQVILETSTLKNSYTNAPVVEILGSLEENFGIDIQYDSAVLANCTLTSDMSDEGFYEQIKIICNALGGRYTIEETAVLIEATGCNVR